MTEATYTHDNPSRGVVIVADNNEQIDYIKIAAANAAMVRHHMGVPVTLITSQNHATWESDQVKGWFDHIEVVDTPDIPHSDQSKSFVGYGKYEKLRWRNTTRVDAYTYTPYDETILLDADYLILNDSLNACWGSSEDIMMSSTAIGVLGETPHLKERRLFDTNIPMSWATVVYFKSDGMGKLKGIPTYEFGKKSKYFFQIVDHVMHNWEYFTQMFNIPSGIYRNDYAFSIAAHLSNDALGSDIPETPDGSLLTSYAADKIMRIRKGEIDLVAQENDWHYPVKVKGQNLHYMNKFDLSERADEILEIYS